MMLDAFSGVALRTAILAMLAAASSISFAAAAPPDRAVLAEQREPHTAISIDPKLLDAYAGFYRNPASGSLMVVAREGNHLLTRRVPASPVAEYPYTDHDFFLTTAPEQNSFVTDASGAAVRVIHHRMGRSETLDRISANAAQQDEAALAQRLAAQRAPQVEVPIDPQLLDAYAGTYQLTPRLIFTVTRDGGNLMARLTGRQTYQVHPFSDRDFFYTVVAAQLSFVPGSDGRASALILHQGGRDLTAERVDPAVAAGLDRRLAEERQPHSIVGIDPHLLDLYVGRYRDGQMEIIASRAGEQLFVQVTGYQRTPIYPYDKQDFFATTIPAQISFASDGTGKATQMIRHEHGVDTVLNRVD